MNTRYMPHDGLLNAIDRCKTQIPHHEPYQVIRVQKLRAGRIHRLRPQCEKEL